MSDGPSNGRAEARSGAAEGHGIMCR
jgi:hypothetical protein